MSSRKMPVRLREWPFKDQKWACEALPVVQMALQTEKNFFQINYGFHSRYRRILFGNLFCLADADTAVLCGFEGSA